MIISFLNENFKGLQNNASLVVDKNGFNLVKKPVDLNEFSCVCQAFTEDIQPTFLVVKDNLGRYIYGCLAGIPILNKNNQTQISGTDLKSLLSSDILLTAKTFSSVKDYINEIFNEWKSQVNQNSFNCELVYKDSVGDISFDGLEPINETRVVNALTELQNYLRRYNLFITSDLDLVNKNVVFTIGKTMLKKHNLKLWDYNIKNYGKWIAGVNECQGYYDNNGTFTAGNKWILTSNNEITLDSSKRDIFPIKKKIVVSNESVKDSDIKAITKLLDYLFNEDITINSDNLNIDFETRFEVYVKRGEQKYKDLPCGALYFNSNGLYKFQVGYRYTSVDFI